MAQTVRWERGEREVIGSTDPKTGRFTARTGKNGGPVVKQSVLKIIVLK